MRILILKPSSLGDVVLAIPILRSLKQAYPVSEIYWWLSSDLLSLLEDDPDLTRVIPFRRRNWHSCANVRELVGNVRTLRSLHFDWVIDLQGLFRSAALGWLVRGKVFVGLSDFGEGARFFFDVPITRSDYYIHAKDYYQSVLKALNVPMAQDFEWLPLRPRIQEAILSAYPTGNRRLVALVPGARRENKRWPIQYFIDLVGKLLVDCDDLQFVVLGGAADRELGDRLYQAAPERCWNLAGKTTLAEMVEWIRLSQLVVTNDSGPMHVAAALARPVVAMFGPTEPRRTGPYGQLEHVLQATLPCVPCMSHHCHHQPRLECLRLITPAMVRDAARHHLRATPNRTGSH
jgi:lipopolysaccharide heptosyltransferase II